MSSRSGTRASLPESTAEEMRVGDALRKHKLVSHEATIFTDDPVHCFFRQDVKKWLRDNYKLLHRNGIIEDWLTEYPDIASRIEEAGLRGQFIKKVKNQEWQIFCNGYALNGFLPSGIHPRMGDNYTCIAVTNIYITTVNVHIGLETRVRFTPYTDGTYCTIINLVQYCAPNWNHFRSTRPMSSPPASPGPASADLELAEAWPAGVVSSGRTGAESWGGMQEILLMYDGPASH